MAGGENDRSMNHMRELWHIMDLHTFCCTNAWLKKNMPLLQSRSGDPWVKEVLAGLAGYGKLAC